MHRKAHGDAADPILAPWQEPADLDVVQTGAWIVPDERPLPADSLAFLRWADLVLIDERDDCSPAPA